MRAFLLFLIAASSAAAQTPDSTAAQRGGPPADLVFGGAAAGITAVLLGNIALRTVGVSEESRSVAFLLYPVGAAAGVYEIGRISGHHGTWGATARGALRGTLLGAGGILLAGFGLGEALNRNGNAGVASLLFVGLAVVVAAPPYFAAAGYHASDVAPVVLRGPDGERAAGLALRVGL